MAKLFSTLAIMSAAVVAAFPARATEQQVRLDAVAGSSVIKAGETGRVFLRIGLESAQSRAQLARAPLNVSIVIDRSGSMAGAKMEEAKRAAIMAIGRLSARDIVSVVSYDDRVEVEVPATRASDTRSMVERIRKLTPRGSTAIHAGLIAGAAEVRKFKSREMVNRIVLLSDGLANVGPQSPRDFVSLGRELGSEGIVVSTVGLGLGYNEDLMAGLARAADGNHKFVQEPQDLAAFFAKEFDEAQSIVGQDAIIRIIFPEGARPIRSLGREAEIKGNVMLFRVGQLVGGTTQVLLAELEVVGGDSLDAREIARVEAEYRSTSSAAIVRLDSLVQVRASREDAEVVGSFHTEVMRDVTLLEAQARNDEAIRLRDAGHYEEAKKRFLDNAAIIDRDATKYGLSGDGQIIGYRGQAKIIGETSPASPAWSAQRKQLREQGGNAAGASTRY